MNVILSLVLCVAGIGFVPTVDNTICAWDRFQFEAPLPFSGPQKLGLDAVAFIHPAGLGIGQGKIEITLVSFPKDMVEGLGMNEKELFEYFKTTFLGAGPGQKAVERPFLGKPIKGDWQVTAIPKARRLEAYLIPLPDGGRLGLAVSALTAVPDADFEATAASVSKTLKLVEPK